MTAKVAVAIPSTGLVDIRWLFNTHNFLNNLPAGSTYFAEWRYGIAQTREMLVENALQIEGTTHICFLDSDLLPPINAVEVMLAHNKPIVSGLYFNSLHSGVAAWVGERTIALEQPGDLVQVDKVGMGLCLIDLNIFRDLRDYRPWFYYHAGNGKIESEDFYFFELVAKHTGIKPWVDMRVKCGHIKPFIMAADGKVD